MKETPFYSGVVSEKKVEKARCLSPSTLRTNYISPRCPRPESANCSERSLRFKLNFSDHEHGENLYIPKEKAVHEHPLAAQESYNNTTKKISKSGDTFPSLDCSSRIISLAEKNEKSRIMLEQAREDQIQKELKECSFKPKILDYSRKIANKILEKGESITNFNKELPISSYDKELGSCSFHPKINKKYNFRNKHIKNIQQSMIFRII